MNNDNNNNNNIPHPRQTFSTNYAREWLNRPPLWGEGDALKPLAKYYENKKENNKFSITPPLAENVQLQEGLGCHEITWNSQGG